LADELSDNDGFADLAAAAPLEDVGAISQAGAVSGGLEIVF
jgi:hypothetical protein